MAGASSEQFPCSDEAPLFFEEDTDSKGRHLCQPR